MCGPGILAPWEVEVGGLQMRGQPGQASETLGQSKQWEKKISFGLELSGRVLA